MAVFPNTKNPKAPQSTPEVNLLTLTRLGDHPAVASLRSRKAALQSRAEAISQELRDAKAKAHIIEQREQPTGEGWTPSLPLLNAEAEVARLEQEARIITANLPTITTEIVETESRLRRQVTLAVERALVVPLERIVQKLEDVVPDFEKITGAISAQHRLTGEHGRYYLQAPGLAGQIRLFRHSLDTIKRGLGDTDVNTI